MSFATLARAATGSLVIAAPLLATSPAPADALNPLDASPAAFTNVNVISMATGNEPGIGAIRANCTVIVENGRITAVGPSSEIRPPADARIVDGHGKLYLIPGLCDMHVHLPPMIGQGPSQAASADAQSNASLGDPTWRAVTLLLANGVTTARGLIGHDQHIELRRRANSGELLSPTLYVAGPPLTANSAPDAEKARAIVKEQKDKGFDCIKSHRVIKTDVYDAIQQTARDLNIPVAGHVDNEVGIDRAIAAHQQVEHMDGCLAWILKDPELAMQFGQIAPPQFMSEFDESRIDPLAQKLATAGIWMTPTQSLFSRIVDVTLSAEDLLKRPEMGYITDQALQAWTKQRTDTFNSAGFTPEYAKQFTGLRASMIRAFLKAGVPLLAGSDSPQVFGVVGYALHEEIESLQAAGLTPWQALQTATANPARYLKSLPSQGSATGVPADFGTIEPGQRADLVLLEADPTADISNTRKIAGVMLRGKWLDRAALDGLLKQVAKSAKAPPA